MPNDTTPQVVERTYHPEADDLRACVDCKEVTLPFPDRWSATCSWCWFQGIKRFARLTVETF